jgi:type VI secretion system protein ImpI
MANAPRLTLRIINADALPDGGPLFHSTQGRNFEAGRNRAMAWVLPDPHNHISGEHFRVIWHGMQYWLQDVSSNGTYLLGQSTRLTGPHALASRDRFQVGQYLIEAEITAVEAPVAQVTPTPGNIWALDGGAAQAPATPTHPQPALQPAFTQPPFTQPPIPQAPVAQPPIPQPVPEPAFAQAPFAQAPFAPAPAPAPAVTFPPAALPGATAAPGVDLMAAFARGAGLPPSSLTGPQAEAVAEEIGRCLRIATEQLMGLLAGRAATKKVLKSRNRTMIGADGNPLKLADDAAAVMLALFAQRTSYMMAPAQAYAEGFDDLKHHQAAIFSAMQSALAKLLEDLSPETIEAATTGGAFSSRKAQAWEVFTERWDAKTRPHENGMLDVFLAHFSAAYDATAGKTRPR